MFDEIFTYSQSISSSCKNSLVSARKGKRGSRAHIELSYFVSFFSTPAHSFHLITSPPAPKVSCLLCGSLIPCACMSLFLPRETSLKLGVRGSLVKITVLTVLWTRSLFWLEMDPHVGPRWEEHYRQTSTAKPARTWQLPRLLQTFFPLQQVCILMVMYHLKRTHCAV